MSLWTVLYDARGKHILDGDRSRPYRWYHAVADALYDWWAGRDWRRRQREFQRTGTRYYGDGGTIHCSGYVDVEVRQGEVVAVWFRCQPLPFKAHHVDLSRAAEMTKLYDGFTSELHGVEIRD